MTEEQKREGIQAAALIVVAIFSAVALARCIFDPGRKPGAQAVKVIPVNEPARIQWAPIGGALVQL
jgi:hypothetical protein